MFFSILEASTIFLNLFSIFSTFPKTEKYELDLLLDLKSTLGNRLGSTNLGGKNVYVFHFAIGNMVLWDFLFF